MPRLRFWTKDVAAGETPPIGGLFDFQINGFAGVDFQRDGLGAADLRRAVEGLRRHGTEAIFVTLITDEIGRLCAKLRRFETLLAGDAQARRVVAGYHLEGPWISPEEGYRGAHPAGRMRAPDFADFQRLQTAAGGHIRLVTLAPEWPGSAEFIGDLVRRGVQVSLGHTNADDRQIDAAIAAGARFCTHLGNGTPAALPRHDNIINRLLARDELVACLIPDGHHLPPFVLRNYFRAKPAGRILFTTDAMAASGAPPGRYTLGDMEVEVGQDQVPRQPGGGGFAGSSLAPDEGVRRAARALDLSLPEALRLWRQSASLFGVELPDAPRAAPAAR